MTSTVRGTAAAWCVALTLVASERGASQPPFPTGSQAEAIILNSTRATPSEPVFIPSPNNELRVNHLVRAVSTFTLLHELGHMVVDEYQVPVIGREENGADRFATFRMTPLQPRPAGSPPDMFDPVTDPDSPLVIWAAWGWYEWWKVRQAAGEIPNYADRHGLDIDRAVEVMCLVYGADSERFEQPFRAFVPEQSRAECRNDSDANAASWNQVLTAGDSRWKYRARVTYNPAPPELAATRTWLLEHRVLEEFAELWLDRLAVPSDSVVQGEYPALMSLDPYRLPIDVVADSCETADGEFDINAGWAKSEKTIVICYNLVAFFDTLARQAIARTEIGQREKMPE